MVDFQGAHAAGGEEARIADMDRPLVSLVTDLMAADPNTVIMLYSDHGRTHTEFRNNAVPASEYRDVLLWVLASGQALGGKGLALARNAALMDPVTGFDIYATILDLAGQYDHPALPPWGRSLVRDQDALKRQCAEAGVPYCMCSNANAAACMKTYSNRKKFDLDWLEKELRKEGMGFVD